MEASARASSSAPDLGRTADPAPTGIPPFDDVPDSPEDLAVREPLGRALRACDEIIAPAYRRADAAALGHQWQHRAITVVAVVFGTIAVVFAVLQLSGLLPGVWPSQVEVVAALVALASVVLGIVAARQRRWLIERHKAERYRLLKFRFLTDPAAWSDDPTRAEARIDQLRAEVRQVEAVDRDALDEWMEEDQIPEPPASSTVGPAADDRLGDLIAYYRRKRLGAQMRYFEDRMRRNQRLDLYTRRLPPGLFFGSVLAALGHFSYDLLVGGHGHDTLSVLLIVLAATLAVLGAGVRTFRAANEFARNTSRFRAKYDALGHLAERLQNETDPTAVFRDLWCCEQILESEHREWLRLMTDAEWFG